MTMKPWVVDANEMDAEQIVAFEHNLLHPNPEISDFLNIENKSTTIVIAPKGYGKTLLLKAKCKSLQGFSAHMIPANGNLVDKPVGAPHVIKTHGYGDLRESDQYWHNLWLSAFALAIIKETAEDMPPLPKALNSLLMQDNLRSPCDIFIRLTRLDISKYHQMHAFTGDVCTPILRGIRKSVVTFVDNIDEYYDDILLEAARNISHNLAGKQDKSFWYRAQLGLAQAARGINHINPHLKIYVSIRKEVLQKATTGSSFGTQLRGKSLLIEYSREDLEAIIEKNIRAESNSRFIDPSRRDADPVAAFFHGVDHVIHPATRDQESVVAFWLRHTLGRPRDVVSIGAKLSALPPEKRSAGRVRMEVTRAAADLVRAYISEIQPHLDRFDPELLYRELKSNVLTPLDIVALSRKYDWKYHLKYGTPQGETQVFTSLYNIGLLGFVASDGDARKRFQKFRSPGEEMLDENRVLPEASLYLIHPTLDEVIQAVNPTYYDGLNDENIVGPDRSWETGRIISYILKGDVAGSSRFMRAHDTQKHFEACLDRIIEEYGVELEFKRRDGGDSMKLVSKNPIKLLEAAWKINAALEASDMESRIRFGGDSGFITTTVNGGVDGQQHGVWGEAVLIAARLEPYVRPGQIYVTRRFMEAYDKKYLGSRVFEFTKCGPDDMNILRSGPAPCTDGCFNLNKSDDSEGSDNTEVYCVTDKRMTGGDHG